MQNFFSFSPTKFLLQLLSLLMVFALELVVARVIMQYEFQRHVTTASFTPPPPSPRMRILPSPTPIPPLRPSGSVGQTTPLPPKPPTPPTFNYTGDDVWNALANYRSAHRKYQFIKDERLCTFARMRVDQLIAVGTLDGHQGFKDYFANEDNFKVVGFARVAENLAFGFPSAVQVIEWGWDTSTEGHREAQLTEEFTHACVVADQGFAVLELGTDPF